MKNSTFYRNCAFNNLAIKQCVNLLHCRSIKTRRFLQLPASLFRWVSPIRDKWLILNHLYFLILVLMILNVYHQYYTIQHQYKSNCINGFWISEAILCHCYGAFGETIWPHQYYHSFFFQLVLRFHSDSSVRLSAQDLADNRTYFAIMQITMRLTYFIHFRFINFAPCR